MPSNGPQLDPNKVALFEQGFTGKKQTPQPTQPQSPQSLASAIAQAYAAARNGENPETSVTIIKHPTAPDSESGESPDLLGAEQNADANYHAQQLKAAAQAARDKYLKDNNLDENLNPIQK